MTGSTSTTSFRPGELEIHADGSGNLVGSHCGACGSSFFPVRQACSGCLNRDLETVPLSTEGVLYTYSVVRQAAPQFEVPYILGYVDLPEGLRIMGQVSGISPDDVRIGMSLELVLEPFGTDDEGAPLTGFRFRPVEVAA